MARLEELETTYRCPHCGSIRFEDAGVRTVPYEPTTGYGGDSYSMCYCLNCREFFADEEVVVEVGR